MEAPLGYLDEKELGVQKLKKPPEVQVWATWVSGPGQGRAGSRGPSGLAQNSSGLPFGPLGLEEQVGSQERGSQPRARSWPCPPAEASPASLGPADGPGQSGR